MEGEVSIDSEALLGVSLDPAGVLVEECAGLVGAPYQAGILVGTSGLRCLGLAAMSVWY